MMEFITGVRSVRNQAGVPPKEKVSVFVRCEDQYSKLLLDSETWIKKLAGISELKASQAEKRPEKCLVAVGRGFQAFVPVEEYLDFDKEKIRLENEVKRVEKIVGGLNGKLSNENFVKRAPDQVIKKTREQLENLASQLVSLKQSLDALV